RLGDTDVNDTIAGSTHEYQHLLERQRKVRLLGVSTLGLMTLLLLFASTWVAIHLSRGFAAPIRSLVSASKEVARGNLGHRVDTIADEELALLAESFNQMTAELDANRKQLEAGAAWSEVARRVAHEIKNPLTPIQLSAERIARNFGLGVTRRSSQGIDQALTTSNGDHGAENGNGANLNGNHEELTRVVEECTNS